MMDQRDYREYPRNSVVDERFGEPNFDAWKAFDSSGLKKRAALNAFHLAFASIGTPINEARKHINTFTTVAYLVDGQDFTAAALNNANYYSEEGIFGKYYSNSVQIDKKEREAIRNCLESQWGTILAQELHTTTEAILAILDVNQPQLIIQLTEGAVQNGYIPISDAQAFFPPEYLGGQNEMPESPKFRLDLPDGTVITTDIRSSSGRGGRIRFRFYEIFKRFRITAGTNAIIHRVSPQRYSLTFSFSEKQLGYKRPIVMPTPNLNQILYGPPGTGKTYATVNMALEILEPEFAAAHANDRASLRKRFGELTQQGRIEFVTFHQSFSYEDFVEGLKATSDEGKISYYVDDGVFKRICILDQAVVEKSSQVGIDIGNRKIWKMSLGATQGEDAYIYEHCIDQNVIRLGYGNGIDFSSAADSAGVIEAYSREGIAAKAQDYKVAAVNTFKNKISIGDLIVVSDGNKKFRAIGEVTGEYEHKPDESLLWYAQCRNVIWHKAWDRSLPFDQLLTKAFSQMTLYQLHPKRIRKEKLEELLGSGGSSESGSIPTRRISAGTQLQNDRYEVTYVSDDIVRVLVKKTGSTVSFDMGLLQQLFAYVAQGEITAEDIKKKRVFDKTESNLEKFIVNGYPGLLGELVDLMTDADLAPHDAQRSAQSPRVLIIDEINRGNIANIFGELITLIEPSKRAGAEEAIEVTLPYSKEKFSVPSNIYIIGTMNTADRSLVHVDTALRRRFTFIETPPDLNALEGIVIEGVNVRSLLESINNRIELIYDREHRIGHSYFLPLKSDPTMRKLASIFSDQVIPLLEEYFFEDWSRINQVLRMADKETSHFLEPKFSEEQVQWILGDQADQVGVVYKRSTSGLLNPASYISIYQSVITE